MKPLRCVLQLIGLIATSLGLLLTQEAVSTAGVPEGHESEAVRAGSIPRLIRFSGPVREADGKIPTGSVTLTFSLYTTQTGGAPLWSETQRVNLDAQGDYLVLLGASLPAGLPQDLFTSEQALWLGVQPQLSGVGELPRVLLVSVPYALKAADAETLAGKPVSDFVLAQQLKEQVKTEVAQQAKKQQDRGQQALALVLGTGPTPQAMGEGPSSFICSTSSDCVAMTQSGTGRALNAAATSSSEAVLVQQSGTGYGLRATAASVAVYGVSTATTGSVFAVRGESASTTGRGILGYATAATGGTIGLYGSSLSTTGTGLYGEAPSTTGTSYGIRAKAFSTSGTAIYALALATTGTTKGLWAQVQSADGTAAVFQNTASGKLFSGVVGTGTGTEVFSVAGSGNLVSAGTLSGTQLISTVASGTAPLVVASNTLVPNLNASLLGGQPASAFSTILAVNPAAGGG